MCLQIFGANPSQVIWFHKQDVWVKSFKVASQSVFTAWHRAARTVSHPTEANVASSLSWLWKNNLIESSQTAQGCGKGEGVSSRCLLLHAGSRSGASWDVSESGQWSVVSVRKRRARFPLAIWGEITYLPTAEHLQGLLALGKENKQEPPSFLRHPGDTHFSLFNSSSPDILAT